MKKLALFIVIVLIGGASAFAQTVKTKNKRTVKTRIAKAVKSQAANKPAAIEREKFNPSANPNDDLQKAVAEARKENKRIVLDIGGEWCGWCHEMDAFIARNKDLNELREKNFVWLKINFSEENKNAAFLAKYPQIKGYPHLYVLETDGTFIRSKDTSELEDGVKSYNLQKFTDFLNEYAPQKSATN